MHERSDRLHQTHPAGPADPVPRKEENMKRFADVFFAAPVTTALVLAVSLGGCNRQADSNPGSTPGSTGSGATPAASSGTDSRAPGAGDSPAGGSSGFKGSTPAADASGAPSTGGSSAAQAGPEQGTASSPSTGASGATAGVTTNGGLPASQLGNATTSGSKNSSPNNSTGNASR